MRDDELFRVTTGIYCISDGEQRILVVVMNDASAKT